MSIDVEFFTLPHQHTDQEELITLFSAYVQGWEDNFLLNRSFGTAEIATLDLLDTLLAAMIHDPRKTDILIVRMVMRVAPNVPIYYRVS